MKLYATSCNFEGRRVWLESDTDDKARYMNYKASLGQLLIVIDEKLPKVMPIDLKGISDGKD